MNVPYPLLVLHGPKHIITLSNCAQRAENHGASLVGNSFESAFPEFAAHALPILDRVYRDGETVREKEIAIGARTFNATYLPLRGNDGLIEGVIVSTLDVTAEVLARATVENQKRWAEFVLDLIPIPTVVVQTGTGEVLLTNAAGKKPEAVWPREPAPAISDGYYFTDVTGNRIAAKDWPRQRAARGEELYGLQLIWHTPERKTPLVVESRRLPSAFGHSEVFAIHYQDVSDIKEAETSLRENVTELHRERDLREQFVATLTHDLRNPLTAAKLTAQIIARENPNSRKIGTLSGRICGNIARADQMVRDLLDANRLKAGGRFPLRLGAHVLNEIAQNCIDGLTILHGDRFVLECDEKIRGRWCRASLKRIFENLCGNAAKYGLPGTPITVRLTAENGKVLIRVHNFGTAIKSEDRSELFRPYHRASAAVSGMKRGWGLGLTLVRGLAEAHGGSVGLDFSDERGTQFYVHLPLFVESPVQA